MMYKIIFFVSLFATQFFFSQRYEVTYTSTLNMNAKEFKNLPSVYKELIAAKKDHWFLKTDGKQSTFTPTSDKNQNKMVYTNKDFVRKELKIKNSKSKDIQTRKMQNLVFNLSKETKEIAGYTCQKAIKNGYTIYFTKQILLKDGPEDAYYYPGLVLEYSTPYMTYTATSVSKVEDSKGTP